MSRDFRPRDALWSLGIGYAAYKLCRFVWGYPLLFVMIWGGLTLWMWLDGTSGWDAVMEFMVAPVLLGWIATFALLASGSVISAGVVFAVMAIIIDMIQGCHECSVHTCYYQHQDWWNDIPTAHGWVHTLPAGVQPLPGWHYQPGLIARCWNWLAAHQRMIWDWIGGACLYAALSGYLRFRRYRRWKRWHPE